MQELMPRRPARECFEPGQSGTRGRIGDLEGTQNKQYNNFTVIISFSIGPVKQTRNWLCKPLTGEKFCETYTITC